MASAVITRSLSSRPNPKTLSKNPRVAKPPLKYSIRLPSRLSPPRASIKENGGGGGGGNGNGNDSNRALELNRIFNGFPPDKDSQTLPRPLTTSDVSNLGSGSRLKVAYQAFEF